MTASKKALVVRGGWNGHQPIETTDLFIPYLRTSGYDVRIEESPRSARTRTTWPPST